MLVANGTSIDFKHSECDLYLLNIFVIRERDYI